MFNVGQHAAVRSAFSLAGYTGELRTLPVTSGDEQMFVLPPAEFSHLHGHQELEQVLTQLLGLKVVVLEGQPTWETTAFDA